MRAFGRWALWSLVVFGVLIGILRMTAIRWWRIPVGDPYLEASIAPSLHGGDLVLLWRLTPPVLGALALCPEPKHSERQVLGRLIGEERNTVRVEGTHVFVNEKVLATEGHCANDHFKVTPPQGGSEIELSCSMEVASGLLHPRGDADSTADIPAFEVELKTGQVAIVSDNRRYPYDSRDYGAVERATCTDTVFFKLFGSSGFFDAANRFQYVR